MIGIDYRRKGARFTGLAACLFAGTPGYAGEADVRGAEATCLESRCTLTVTVGHDDTGWDHYADHWRILTPGGEEIGRRVLLHPHENEQPFTRSLSGVEIPPALTHVIIEAHDIVHDYGGMTVTLSLQRD